MDVLFNSIITSPVTPVSLALACVSLIVVSFIRGWILPRNTVNLLLEAEKTRSEDFKAAWEAEKEKNDILLGYLQKLLTYAETTDRLVRALPTIGKESGSDAK